MVDLVKGLGKVKVYGVHVMALLHFRQYGVVVAEQLRDGGEAVSEPVLCFVHKILALQMYHEMFSENPLEDLGEMVR